MQEPPPSASGHSTPRTSCGGDHRPFTPHSAERGVSKEVFSGERGWLENDSDTRSKPTFVDTGSTGIAGGAGGAEPAEMTCVEVVDLGDVLGVHQEESSPEQVN